MKKYVVIISLFSSPVSFENATSNLMDSASSIKELELKLSDKLFGLDPMSVGNILSFSVTCFSYGEYSKEKSLELESRFSDFVHDFNKKVENERNFHWGPDWKKD